jgi:hypothetical protein
MGPKLKRLLNSVDVVVEADMLSYHSTPHVHPMTEKCAPPCPMAELAAAHSKYKGSAAGGDVRRRETGAGDVRVTRTQRPGG